MLEQEGHEAGEGVGAREFMSRQTRDSRYPRLKRYPNEEQQQRLSSTESRYYLGSILDCEERRKFTKRNREQAEKQRISK